MAYKVVVVKQSTQLGAADQRIEYGPYDSIDDAWTTGQEHKAAGAFDCWITTNLGVSGGKFYMWEFID